MYKINYFIIKIRKNKIILNKINININIYKY